MSTKIKTSEGWKQIKTDVFYKNSVNDVYKATGLLIQNYCARQNNVVFCNIKWSNYFTASNTEVLACLPEWARPKETIYVAGGISTTGFLIIKIDPDGNIYHSMRQGNETILHICVCFTIRNNKVTFGKMIKLNNKWETINLPFIKTGQLTLGIEAAKYVKYDCIKTDDFVNIQIICSSLVQVTSLTDTLYTLPEWARPKETIYVSGGGGDDLSGSSLQCRQLFTIAPDGVVKLTPLFNTAKSLTSRYSISFIL